MSRRAGKHPVDFFPFALKETGQILRRLDLVDHHQQGHFIRSVQKLFIAVVMNSHQKIRKIRHIRAQGFAQPDSVLQTHAGSPLPAALIINDGQNRRKMKLLPLRTARTVRLRLFCIFRPDTDHITKQLHSYIIIHRTLMFNQRYQKQIPVPFTIFQPNPFYSIRFELNSQIGFVLTRHVIDILRHDIFKNGNIDVIPQKLGHQRRVLKNLPAVHIADLPFPDTEPFSIRQNRLPFSCCILSQSFSSSEIYVQEAKKHF